MAKNYGRCTRPLVTFFFLVEADRVFVFSSYYRFQLRNIRRGDMIVLLKLSTTCCNVVYTAFATTTAENTFNCSTPICAAAKYLL